MILADTDCHCMTSDFMTHLSPLSHAQKSGGAHDVRLATTKTRTDTFLGFVSSAREGKIEVNTSWIREFQRKGNGINRFRITIPWIFAVVGPVYSMVFPNENKTRNQCVSRICECAPRIIECGSRELFRTVLHMSLHRRIWCKDAPLFVFIDMFDWSSFISPTARIILSTAIKRLEKRDTKT